MIDYLEREGYLAPSYRGATLNDDNRKRGRVRYYSYRDLVIARLIQRIRETGVELRRIKRAMEFLRTDAAWEVGVDPTQASSAVKWLVFDGKELLLKNSADPFLDQLKVRGQRSFAFFFNVDATSAEVKKQIVDRGRRRRFTLAIEPLEAAPPRQKA